VQYRIWIMPREDFNRVETPNTPRPLYGPAKESSLDSVGLRIEMFDGFKREHEGWKAEGRAELNLRASEGRREKRTEAAVAKLLAKFPPK